MCANETPKLRPSKEYLKELIFNEVSLEGIANIVEWSIVSVRKFLKEYDLPTPYQFRRAILRERHKNDITVMYMRLNGIKNIASKTPFSWEAVTMILNEMGVLTDLHLGAHLMKARLTSGWRPLPPHLQQVLEGELLGDGWLRLTTTTPSYKCLTNEDDIINALDDLQWFSWVDVDTELEKLQASISLFNTRRETLSYLQGAYYSLAMAPCATRWVEYIASQFRENGYYVNIYSSKTIIDGVEHPMIGLQTESSLNLSIEWLRWYGLVKGVPWDFELTPTSLLHWFMGDGCFAKEITFATHGFHWNEVEFLTRQLRQKVGVKAKIDWRPVDSDCPGNPNRNWVIVVPANSASRTRFLAYLRMAPGYRIARRVFPWKFSKSIQKQDCV
ncbi:MAG: hypothetical protein ACFFC7_17715 [Candidatus Hermodarchaeota archaeon]